MHRPLANCIVWNITDGVRIRLQYRTPDEFAARSAGVGFIHLPPNPHLALQLCSLLP